MFEGLRRRMGSRNSERPPDSFTSVTTQRCRIRLPSDMNFHPLQNGMNGWAVNEVYHLGSLIGRGNFGAVYKGRHRLLTRNENSSPQRDVAIKHTRPNILDQCDAPDGRIHSYRDLARYCHEVRTLLALREGSAATSPVLYLYEIFMTRRDFYMVTEMLEEGLEEWRRQVPQFTEKMAIDASKTILSAIEFMHCRNVVHRDLKLENIMFRRRGDTKTLKIVDFGLARVLEEGQMLNDYCGSIGYLAPEIHLGEAYRFEVDMFAFGVVLFRLLSGERPFPYTNSALLKRHTIECRYNVSSGAWQDISPTAKEFIRKLLINREERATAEQALSHHWFREAGTSVLPRDLTRVSATEQRRRAPNDNHSRTIARSQRRKSATRAANVFLIDEELRMPLVQIISAGIYSAREVDDPNICANSRGLLCIEETPSPVSVPIPELIYGQMNSYTERDCRNLVLKITRAIKTMHDAGIAHRNLHLGNLVVDPSVHVTVEGFRYAQPIIEGMPMTGHLNYVYSWYAFKAPELDDGFVHDKSVDLWSLGAILYMLLTGIAPFPGDGMGIVERKHAGVVSFDAVPVSPYAQRLVLNLLQPRPDKRYSVDDVLNDRWMIESDDFLAQFDLGVARGMFSDWQSLR